MATSNAVSSASILCSPKQGSLRRRVNHQQNQRLNCGQSVRRFTVRANAKDIAFDQNSRMALQSGIDKLADAVGLTLGPRAVASISAGNDELIGTMVADAIDKVGPDGVLSIESSSSFETTVEVEEGMEVCFAALNVKDVAIKALEFSAMFCQMHFVLLNFARSRQYKNGAEFQASDLGLLIENTSVEQLGLARKVTITKDSTTIIADVASKDELQARIAQLKKELSETDSVYDSQKLAERIAKLSGGVAVIKVGAATETELEDRNSELRMPRMQHLLQ
ncbi:hypothetical protein GH714_002267 [Hevea brasiliensis]|uniref:Uncharacterized protein n=1 Tax=Hevea brasiliensis TaxID=3981 RepID=A0A6A6K3M8_HEVBR|nr:hypothetical protein GH714_002267 [Hevea brasiliensis]